MLHRVIVWGTGNAGVPALRIVLSNPALELAGVIVANQAKVGRDAGELCGRPPTNTTAAARIVNAIPFVCQAPPGLLDALRVPLAIGRGLVRA
jgi:hypothetical protein